MTETTLSFKMQQQTSSNPPPNTPSFQIPDYVLDDLCSRFIINIPEEERQDLIRIFFQIELAHWFYLDFYCADNPQLKTCGIKDFSAQIFRHCPSLSGHAAEVDKILGNWKSYKMSVPTYGGIMLDPHMKYCLLVQGFWAKASWGFPKGKVNESEDPLVCAVRELYEETGFDVSGLVNKDDYLENKINDQLNRLYIIQNVPLDTKFQPKTRKEIKSLQWFPLDALPAHKRDQVSKTTLGLNPNTFFMVIPFVKQLRKWVANKQSGNVSGAVAGKPPSRPRLSSTSHDNNPPSRPRLPSTSHDNNSKASKDTDNQNTSTRNHRDQQKQKQQQMFAQMNQNEYQELLQFKDSKTRAREVQEHKQKAGKDKGGNTAHVQGYIAGSPGYKSDQKPQFHILNRDGTVGGKPRRSLATQFDNQGTPPHQSKQTKYDRRQRRQDPQRVDGAGNTAGDGGYVQGGGCGFVPPAWANFKFDVDSIMACIG